MVDNKYLHWFTLILQRFSNNRLFNIVDIIINLKQLSASNVWSFFGGTCSMQAQIQVELIILTKSLLNFNSSSKSNTERVKLNHKRITGKQRLITILSIRFLSN